MTTSFGLIDLTDEMREQLDCKNFACGIFTNHQVAFDTVDRDILIKKLNQYIYIYIIYIYIIYIYTYIYIYIYLNRYLCISIFSYTFYIYIFIYIHYTINTILYYIYYTIRQQ